MLKGYTVIGALRATAAILWGASDSYAKRTLVLSFGLLILASIVDALSPLVYKLLIDALAGAMNSPMIRSPTFLLVAYISCTYLSNATGALRQVAHGVGTQRMSRRLSNRLFEHIVRLPLRFHLDRKTGAVAETLGQGLNGCQIVLQHAVFTFLPVLIQFVSMVLVLVHFGRSQYVLIMGVSSIAYGYMFWRAAEGVSAPSRTVSESHVDSRATLTDGLLNYETVKYFAGESAICSRYDRTLERTERSWRALLHLRARYGLVLATIYAVCIGVSLGYASREVLEGTMTLGDFVLVNVYITNLYRPLEAIGAAAREVSQALAFLEKMLQTFDEQPEPDYAAALVPPTQMKGALAFERVSFSYRGERQVLQELTFSVPACRTLAIVGASGSGKSSVVRLLFRLYEPTSGHILFDGVPIVELPLSYLRSAIAIVPQDTVLFNDSIGHNIGFGRPGASQQEIEQAAKLAHLHDFIVELPEGYDTQVGERGLKLSGGEKQRVAIARAALKRPAVFVFDEATSSLDSKAEREILRNLIEVSRNCTTIVIAHRLSTVVHADEIVVLDHGIVRERGTHSALLERDGHYAALWRAQQASGRAEGVTARSVA